MGACGKLTMLYDSHLNLHLTKIELSPRAIFIKTVLSLVGIRAMFSCAFWIPTRLKTFHEYCFWGGILQKATNTSVHK